MQLKRKEYITALLLYPAFIYCLQAGNGWMKKDFRLYTINYTLKDKDLVNEYNEIVVAGLKTVNDFFTAPFKNKFDIFIYANRKSLDSAWQKDWNMPGFTSECWMVASGVANKVDIISPKQWAIESCEHAYKDKLHTQQLITHELVHVYHGQLNASPDFSDVDNMDWFVEGLATYASGQCDSVRISEVRKAIAGNTIPPSLDKFWTGNLKYGLSGSMVLYIDAQYGRARLTALLKYNKKDQLLHALETTDAELLSGWAKYITSTTMRKPG